MSAITEIPVGNPGRFRDRGLVGAWGGRPSKVDHGQQRVRRARAANKGGRATSLARLGDRRERPHVGQNHIAILVDEPQRLGIVPRHGLQLPGNAAI